MSTALTVSREQEIVQELRNLNGKFQKASRTAVEAGVRIGELLTEVKASVGHGSFIPWVNEHCEFSHKSAQRYMSAFQVKSDATSNLTGDETITELAALGSKTQVKPKHDNKLTPELLAAHEARVKTNQAKQQATFDSFSSSLKGLLDQTAQHMPAAILDDASPIEYLTQAFATMLQYGGAPAAKLAKQMFSSAYHPDSGKVKHDASLMGSINKALSFLEK